MQKAKIPELTLWMKRIPPGSRQMRIFSKPDGILLFCAIGVEGDQIFIKDPYSHDEMLQFDANRVAADPD